MTDERRIHDLSIAFAKVKLTEMIPEIKKEHPDESEAFAFELESFRDFYMTALNEYSNIDNPFDLEAYFE